MTKVRTKTRSKPPRKKAALQESFAVNKILSDLDSDGDVDESDFSGTESDEDITVDAVCLGKLGINAEELKRKQRGKAKGLIATDPRRIKWEAEEAKENLKVVPDDNLRFTQRILKNKRFAIFCEIFGF